MKYMGSKARIAKYILPIILKERKENQWYVELFSGGLNTICQVQGKRLANDKNRYLIAMWEGLQKGLGRPLIITKELYSQARKEYNNGTNLEFSDFQIGWIGWMGSYNGRFFDGGYSGHCVGKTKRDYIGEQIRNTESQISSIMDVRLFSKDYSEFDFKEPCLIYCDIPYKDTKQYAVSKDFNHNKFWQWCRDMKAKGHTIFVSEYNAPDDFKCVWEKEVANTIKQNSKGMRATEKLFTLE